MYLKSVTPYSNSTDARRLSLEGLKQQHSRFVLDCGFSRANFQRAIEGLQNNYSGIIVTHERMIATVQEQIAQNEKRISEVAFYGEDGEELKSRITSELERQNTYKEGLTAQLAKTKSLKFLFSLNPSELFQEAVKNKPSALLIIQTPELIAKISDEQIEHISHQDSGMVQSLASILAAREYTSATPTIFIALQQHTQAEADKQFIAEKENAAINHLLVKINSYLDTKIAQALKSNSHPWALGYFGSRHKVIQGDKKVSVPRGVYELKDHLAQRGKLPPSEILAKMHNTLHAKNVENKNESLLAQFKRLISYLFGCSQSLVTAKEYEYLEQVTEGKKCMP